MTYVLRPGVLFLRYWPQLAACYLLGLLGVGGGASSSWRPGVRRREFHDAAPTGSTIAP